VDDGVRVVVGEYIVIPTRVEESLLAYSDLRFLPQPSQVILTKEGSPAAAARGANGLQILRCAVMNERSFVPQDDPGGASSILSGAAINKRFLRFGRNDSGRVGMRDIHNLKGGQGCG
jgi:hypothetical protein